MVDTRNDCHQNQPSNQPTPTNGRALSGAALDVAAKASSLGRYHDWLPAMNQPPAMNLRHLLKPYYIWLIEIAHEIIAKVVRR